jgi:hypothetical protein
VLPARSDWDASAVYCPSASPVVGATDHELPDAVVFSVWICVPEVFGPA